MKTLLCELAAILAVFMIMSGCSVKAEDVLARTYIEYGSFKYDSHKDQNIQARTELDPEGRIKAIDIKAISLTPAAAMTMMAELEKQRVEQWGRAMDTLLPLLRALAAAYAPVPIPQPPPVTKPVTPPLVLGPTK